MPSPLPYMQLWVKEWLASSGTRRLSLAGRGLYIDLAFFQWEDGFLPDDTEELAAMVGVSEEEFMKVWPKVERQFPVTEPGKRANERVATDREEALAKVARQSENGSKGGRPKKPIENEPLAEEKPKETQKKPTAFDSVNPKETQTKDKPEPEPEPDITPHASHGPPRRAVRADKPDSLESVKVFGVEIGLPDSECEMFWNHFESNGWKVSGKTLMRDWKAALRKWHGTWKKDQGKATSGVQKGPDKLVPVQNEDYVLKSIGDAVMPMDVKDPSVPFDAPRWFRENKRNITQRWSQYCDDYEAGLIKGKAA